MTDASRRWVRSLLVGALVASAVFAGFGASPAAAAPSGPPTARSPRELEVDMIGRINALRRREHLRPLVEDRPELTGLARAWAASMARDGGISHRPDLMTAAPADWMHLGENVGVGQSIASLHDAFVASPMHHKNLVDPDFRTVAVGVVVRGNRIWVTENFMEAAPAGTTPVASSVELTAPPGGLGHKICITVACELHAGGRRLAFLRL
jgi:uncharacterized protein YkwD